MANSFDEREALERAVLIAQQSPCCKSKRGVVVWGGVSHGVGHNGPPPGFACNGSDACRKACSRLCLHAEHRALMVASRTHTDLLHVKVIDGVATPSGPPSCVDCSKAILDKGIERVWLLHETGLHLYSADDFHVQTLLNNDLPVIRPPEEDPT